MTSKLTSSGNESLLTLRKRRRKRRVEVVANRYQPDVREEDIEFLLVGKSSSKLQGLVQSCGAVSVTKIFE